MKIAVVHDYFTQQGGAERVAEEIYSIFPKADLFATVAFPDLMPDKLKRVPVHTTWLQRMPWVRKYYRLYFLLYPLAVRSLDLSGYDLVLSSSSSYAKGVRRAPDALHVCYCHTPTRWVWSFDSFSRTGSFAGPVRWILPALIRMLKRWDIAAARRPDYFIANSHIVAERIQSAYGRSSEVIYPPIDVGRFRVSTERQDYYVVLSRLVSAKRIDLAVEACTRLNRKLIVIGAGPALAALEAIAGPSISFKGRLSDSAVERYVSGCRALILPGEEDFGMAPLEVAAAGRPTIAFRAGGAIETIRERKTGIFFDQQTPEHLMAAIEESERTEWDSHLMRQHALGFRVEVFQQRLLSFLKRVGARVTVPSLEWSHGPDKVHASSAHDRAPARSASA